MADQNIDTDSNDTNQTGEDQSSVTDTKGVESASQESDKITLSKEDYQNLVSQRDKNFGNSKELEEQIQDLTATIEREKYVKKFLKENKDKYPDIEPEDLEGATSPEEVEAIAKDRQNIYVKAEQKALENLKNVPQQPQMTEDERAKKAEDLLKRAQAGEDVFEEWANLTVL
jgi:hypothetical protein